ncbi:MAG: hypothetical protein ACO20O_11365 [Pseudomonadales bacterium]
MDDTVLALIKRTIEESKDSLEKFLAGGGAESFEQYNRAVGRYEALCIIEGELSDIEKRYIES